MCKTCSSLYCWQNIFIAEGISASANYGFLWILLAFPCPSVCNKTKIPSTPVRISELWNSEKKCHLGDYFTSLSWQRLKCSSGINLLSSKLLNSYFLQNSLLKKKMLYKLLSVVTQKMWKKRNNVTEHGRSSGSTVHLLFTLFTCSQDTFYFNLSDYLIDAPM